MELCGSAARRRTPPPRGTSLTTGMADASARMNHWRGAVWRRGMGVPIALRVTSAAERRKQILDRIARASAVAKRDPADIQLIAVSKGRSAEQIEALIEAGQSD